MTRCLSGLQGHGFFSFVSAVQPVSMWLLTDVVSQGVCTLSPLLVVQQLPAACILRRTFEVVTIYTAHVVQVYFIVLNALQHFMVAHRRQERIMWVYC